MNQTQTNPAPQPADSPFIGPVATAFRGGGILLVGSVLWGLLFERRGFPLFNLLFVWLSSAWLIFPLGAFLGSRLPRWVAGRRATAVMGIGVSVGIVAGLALAAGFWLWTNHGELIGLVTNRASGGYESYSLSVRNTLRAEAWSALAVVVPVTAIWVTGWAVWLGRNSLHSPPALAQADSPPGVLLRFNRHLPKLVGCVAVGIALFAFSVMLLTWLLVRSEHLTLTSLLVAGPMGAGLVVLGPWLGPVINPDRAVFTAAWQWTVVGLPVLLVTLAPFAFRRRQVKWGTATVAWCGFVTALLFWIAAGVCSLGGAMG